MSYKPLSPFYITHRTQIGFPGSSLELQDFEVINRTGSAVVTHINSEYFPYTF